MPLCEPFGSWDDDALAYEIAVEAMSRIAAHYLDLIRFELRKPSPNRTLIDAWTQARDRSLRDRRRLRPDDPTAVAIAREEYGGLVTGLCGGPGEDRQAATIDGLALLELG